MGGTDMGNGTFVGLDVHARSVVAGLIDEQTGELQVRRAPHRTEDLVSWLGELVGPVRVAYEAGPTGFILARALEAQGIGCVVAAPSLIARSPAGRVRKNDASDAEMLVRRLRQGELTPVRVPDPADDAARDLVRALRGCPCAAHAGAPSPLKAAVARWAGRRRRPRLDPCP
jgi:transposase